MADIFVSYSRDDRDSVEPVVEALRAQGLSVFWDEGLRSGEEWRDILEQELDAARAVVVVWTSRSATRRWVKEEATRALQDDKLFQIRLDRVRLPLGFGLIQCEDFSEWRGDRGEDAFRRLMDALGPTLGLSNARADAATVATYRQFVREASVAYGYRDRVLAWLDGLERRLAETHPAGATFLQRAYTFELMNFMIALALVYPAASLLAQFALTGQTVPFGDVMMIDGDVLGDSARLGVLGAALSLILVWRLGAWARAQSSPPLLLRRLSRDYGFAFTTAFVLVFLVSVVSSYVVFSETRDVHRINGAFAVAGNGSVALAVLFALAISGASSQGASLAIAGAFSVAGTFLFIDDLARFLALNFGVSAFDAVALAFIPPCIIAFAVSGVAAAGFERIGRVTRARGLWIAVYILLLFVALNAALSLRGREIGPDSEVSLHNSLIFLVIIILPLLNAIFDFLSVGATRFLIRFGAVQGRLAAILTAAVDLIVGIGLFLALVFGSVLAVHLFNLAFTERQEIISIWFLLNGIRAAPADYAWLFATYFSTLIPTALHLFAAIGAVVDTFLTRPVLRKREAEMRPEELERLALKARDASVISYVIAVQLGCLLVAAAIWGFFVSGAGWELLYKVESFAVQIGALR